MTAPQPLRLPAFVIVGIFALFSASCAQRTREETEELAGPQTISLHLTADPDLNQYDETPASLTLLIYQLTDKRAMDELRDSPDGMAILLSGKKFDDAVAGRERIFLNPGEDRIITLERRGLVKHLAIVAGYNEARRDDALVVADVPPVALPRRWRWRKPKDPSFAFRLTRDSIIHNKSR